MKRNRIIWGVLWILSIVGISFFGGTITYGFFALMTSIPLISLAYLLYVYFFFHMYQKVDNRWLVACQTSPFYFTLMNDYYLLFSGIRVKFYSDFSEIQGLSDETEYEFFPKDGVVKETSLICKYRGEYEVGIETVIVQDFFRLFKISYHNREPLKVVVRPQMVHLSNLKNYDMAISSRDAIACETDPDVLTRAYVLGDDLRTVHWAQSAKSGELMVRKMIGQKQQGVAVLLGTKRFGKKPKEYLPVENKMLETALALTLFFANNHVPVIQPYKTSTLSQKSVTAMEQIDAYYDFISSTMFSEEANDIAFFEEAFYKQALSDCKSVFLIIQEVSLELEKFLWMLNRQNVTATIYVICEKLPEEVLALRIPRIEFVQIKPDDNLMEVM